MIINIEGSNVICCFLKLGILTIYVEVSVAISGTGTSAIYQTHVGVGSHVVNVSTHRIQATDLGTF